MLPSHILIVDIQPELIFLFIRYKKGPLVDPTALEFETIT